MDILAANRIALALSPALCPGVNAVRAILMEPAIRSLYGDGGWEEAAKDAVGRLRLRLAATSTIPRWANSSAISPRTVRTSAASGPAKTSR